MTQGASGTFVISWAQTETDGVRAAALDSLAVGTTWCWTGEAVCVERPDGPLILQGAEGVADTRRRAARVVRRLIGAAVKGRAAPAGPEHAVDEDAPEQGFIVTDGHRSWSVTLLEVPDTGARLAMFVGGVPPAGRELWVVRCAFDRHDPGGGPVAAGGVICFTPGTRIATPTGPRLIGMLRPGDRVLTKDNGPQAVLWTGFRKMSGARLHVMPHLRPVRFRMGALGDGRPDGDLLVSPQHRMLVRGPSAQALFNVDEVLVRAGDLVNDHSVTVDHSLREVTYVHVLLERHNVVFANGLESESFHPANTALDLVEPGQRAALLSVLPGISDDPQTYGGYARRNLSGSEAAILRFDAGR